MIDHALSQRSTTPTRQLTRSYTAHRESAHLVVQTMAIQVPSHCLVTDSDLHRLIELPEHVTACNISLRRKLDIVRGTTNKRIGQCAAA